MRADLAARLGQIHWNLHPLWELAPRVDHKNDGLVESNLLSLSYGQVVRKDINEIGGLRPDSYETYNIIDSGDTVLRMTDLQNDQRSIRTGLAAERGIITSAYITVRPDCDKVEPRFLHSVLRSYDIKKTFYEMGAGVRQTLKYAELADLPIPLPPRDTQRAIADYLDRETGEIDAMIAKMDSLSDVLRDRRMGVASSLFSRGYELVKLKWLMFEIDERAGLANQGLPLLSVSIHHGVQFREESTSHQKASLDLGKYKVARTGQIALNRMRAFQGGLGRVFVDGLVSPDYTVLEANNRLSSVWAEYVMRTPEFIALMTQRLRGIGAADQSNVRTPRINVSDLVELAVPLPSRNEQEHLILELDEVTGKIDAMLAKVAELRSLLIERRAALITDVVTGRKAVA